MNRRRILVPLLSVLVLSCAPKKGDNTIVCADKTLSSNTGSTGTGLAFSLDPMTTSGNANLSPNSLQLDSYLKPVSLDHLGGNGVLEGDYVDVRTGLQCDDWFGASDSKNQFLYSHSDSRFQEVMTYYYGDTYRSNLKSVGYLFPTSPVRLIAHCENDDNAFYWWGKDANGQTEEYVCLGDSVATPGASYADDGVVVIHELQHATTMHAYADTPTLGLFFYDEAGAMNEAISDFMALLHTESFTESSPFDVRTFSRWALGTFIPGYSGIRGAHRCPTYDPTFPNCTTFPNFSADTNTVSYVYPDGLSWAYANNFSGPGYVRNSFRGNTAQEEIHNAGILLVGALWDVYEAVKANHSGDPSQARDLMTEVVIEAVKHLPKPSTLHFSPVTFRGLATEMTNAATLLSLSSADQTSITTALTARGLIGGTQLDSSWLAVGNGVSPNAGLRVEDDANLLKNWLTGIGADPKIVTQGFSTGLNKRLDPGDVAAIWFDLKNVSATTAGGVEVTVTSQSPNVTFLDRSVNWGGISTSQAQINYHKINGTTIVQALTSASATYTVPTGNTYFTTDPFYNRDFRTALWVKVSPSAQHKDTVTFQVKATPTNGAASTANFTATIN